MILQFSWHKKHHEELVKSVCSWILVLEIQFQWFCSAYHYLFKLSSPRNYHPGDLGRTHLEKHWSRMADWITLSIRRKKRLWRKSFFQQTQNGMQIWSLNRRSKTTPTTQIFSISCTLTPVNLRRLALCRHQALVWFCLSQGNVEQQKHGQIGLN